MVLSGSTTPTPLLALACGSRSTSSILRRSDSAADKFTAVVVFPTPPFWFMTPTIGKRDLRLGEVRSGYHGGPNAFRLPRQLPSRSRQMPPIRPYCRYLRRSSPILPLSAAL